MPIPPALASSEREAQDSRLKTQDFAPPIYPRWLFYYYCTHLRISPQPTFVFDVSGCEGKKEAAIRAYDSQFGVNERNRQVVDWVMAATRFFGSRIGTAAGEPFFAREPVGICGLNDLPL
jgi:LmbE family N-acetylglucosaminyl deacetylase